MPGALALTQATTDKVTVTNPLTHLRGTRGASA